MTELLWHSRSFWERADQALDADGELLALHDAYQQARTAAAPRSVAGRASLTAGEREAVRRAENLYEYIAENVIAHGPTRNDDLAELRATVHVIQRMVLAQAAARAYPLQFRLLGAPDQGSRNSDLPATRPAVQPCPSSVDERLPPESRPAGGRVALRRILRSVHGKRPRAGLPA